MQTMEQLQAYLATRSGDRFDPLPALECVDGFSVSMQAGEHLYCEPRSYQGPWTAVELGFPSSMEPALMPYCEDTTRPTQTVYGWVPLSVVAEVVEAHGGLV